jgi:hypothetical protein
MFIGCKKKENPITPEAKEDFNFPESSRFALVLYSDQQTVKVGDAFDVKVILYNASDVFGIAMELQYPSDRILIEDIVTGPYFSPLNDALILCGTEADSGRVSYGITYKAGVTKLSNGSGIIYKLKCKAKSLGTATFTINSEKLEIDKSDGSPIQNFSQIVKENLSITVQ